MNRRDLARTLARRVARDPVLRDVRDASREGGIPAWLVGGAVRDAYLGRRTADVDLAAGPVAASLVRRLRRSWGRRGFRFRKRGVTTWRFVVRGRAVDLVDVERRGIEGDLARRELTLNAVAFDLIREALVDPLGGLADLRRGRLRLPRPGVVREDPVRALRQARFLAELAAFRLDPAAAREASAAGGALRRVAPERVREELDRLLSARGAGRGLETLDRLGLVFPVLPELGPLRDCTAGEGRPDVWRHTVEALAVCRSASRLPGARALRDAAARLALGWALLLHDIAKPETLDTAGDGRPTFHGHEVLGARRAEAVLRRLRAPRELRKRVARLVQLHLRPHHLADAGATPRAVRRLVRDAGEDLPLLLVLSACDARASGAPDATVRWRRLLPVLRRLDEAHASTGPPTPSLVTGGDVMRILGISPGPIVGRVLAEVADRRAEGELATRQEALDFVARWRETA